MKFVELTKSAIGGSRGPSSFAGYFNHRRLLTGCNCSTLTSGEAGCVWYDLHQQANVDDSRGKPIVWHHSSTPRGIVRFISEIRDPFSMFLSVGPILPIQTDKVALLSCNRPQLLYIEYPCHLSIQHGPLLLPNILHTQIPDEILFRPNSHRDRIKCRAWLRSGPAFRPTQCYESYSRCTQSSSGGKGETVDRRLDPRTRCL